MVTLTANMSQAVTVTGGTPTLVLNDGATATYTGGSGTAALTFTYTVAAGQNTANLAVTAVQLNGAAIGTGTPTLVPGSGQSLTDASGHVYTFGASYNGGDYLILRDGAPDGAGVKLALINGVVWAPIPRAAGIRTIMRLGPISIRLPRFPRASSEVSPVR